jgi:hypothetical protein
MAIMFLSNRDEMWKSDREPSIDASCTILLYLTKRCGEEYFFRNRPTRNKNCLWRPYLLTDLDKMCTLYRGPSYDASYQGSIPLAKRFQRRRFLEIDQLETRNGYCGHVC